MHWRNWRLPVKLAAITAVPVLLALALGVLTVREQVERSARYERSDRLVALGGTVLDLVARLQAEREVSARQLSAPAEPGVLLPPRAAVDGALVAVDDSTADLVRPSEPVVARIASARLRTDGLALLRERVSTAALDAVTAVQAYGAIVDGLLEVHRVLASDIADAELARSATALQDLAEATDQLHLQDGLVVATGAGLPSVPVRNALSSSAARLADKLADFRAAASPQQLADFRRTVTGPAVDDRDRQVQRLSEGLAPVGALSWDVASADTIGAVAAVAARVAGPLRDASARLQAGASDRAGLASVLLFATFVLTAAIGVVITRQLLGSLAILRRTALQVADRELPAAVATIRDGQRPSGTVRPVAVHTTEDIGVLARAFDAVHHQALRLAADEATLRTSYGGVFVNLSRRSQGLVQRQLQLLERLERDEEDAEQLATLFQLDHLATRMRRNNENLMVLSGGDLARRSAEPATLVDLLRAAISEIEHYQRIELRQLPTVAVVGRAAGDLVRLIAELLDNATAFSPPDTPVSVAAHRGEGATLVINVLDHGIGMGEDEIAVANRRLLDSSAVDLPTSRQLGLFVVGRLASRHGFTVRLHGGKDLQGVQAAVTVPAELAVAPAQQQPASSLPRTTLNPTLGQPMNSALTLRPPGERGTDQPRYPSLPTIDSALHLPAGGALPRRSRPAGGAASRSNGHPVAARPATPAPDPVPDPVPDPAAAATAAADHGAVTDHGAAPGTWPSWWDTVVESAPAGGVPAAEATTPIFDQMASAWFSAQQAVASSWPSADPDTGPPAPTPAAPDAAGSVHAGHCAEPGEGGPRWSFAADEGWLAVKQVAAATPTDFTPVGLPRRSPRRSLLPGSVAADAAVTGFTERDANEVRGRLSSLRDGIIRGRRGGDALQPADPSVRGESA